VNRRYFYLLLLCFLAIITYLDRVCISVAGPRMQDALGLGPEKWGWVGTVFLIGYAIFEIPGGHMGDRLGARRVLTRIVVWWSAFTALTGAVSSYPLLLLVRFLFGAGEAGSFPNASVAISNWFTPETRGRAFGVFTMCSQVGGAISPLLVIPIQQAFGWRMSFYVFGCMGVVWAAVWFWQFRDFPAGAAPASHRNHEHGQWLPLLRSRDLQAIMGLTFGYVYTMGFYQTWIHTYLVKGRGFSEEALSWSALPYLFGAVANVMGGLACDAIAKRAGIKWSRRSVGMAGLLLAACGLVCTIFAAGQTSVILCLSMAYAGITFQQPVVWTACLDIGGRRGGAVSGFMNTAGQIGGAISSVVFGYIVKATGNYNTPLVPMAILLLMGMALWARVDVTAIIEGNREEAVRL
jgi:predicted MFS family arabinose efflux permease